MEHQRVTLPATHIDRVLNDDWRGRLRLWRLVPVRLWLRVAVWRLSWGKWLRILRSIRLLLVARRLTLGVLLALRECWWLFG